MKFALCNEVLRHLTFPEQCRAASALGYDGLEVAPFTLADDPSTITDTQAQAFARIAEDHGLEINGLHWLLVAPTGLSIVGADAALRRRTTAFMQRLVELCAAMGGKYLVHGSPRQRSVPAGDTHATALAVAASHAHRYGVVYCIEPLSTAETDLLNTVAQAAGLVDAIGSPAFKTMIDCSAAGQVESDDVATLMRRWMPTGCIGHVQVNDPNRRGPGQGAMRFGPILAALQEMNEAGHYSGIVAVEPFDYVPDGMGSAARAIGYLRGLQEQAHG
jgi:sugar phosphate isomerase/epimerase